MRNMTQKCLIKKYKKLIKITCNTNERDDVIWINQLSGKEILLDVNEVVSSKL